MPEEKARARKNARPGEGAPVIVAGLGASPVPLARLVATEKSPHEMNGGRVQPPIWLTNRLVCGAGEAAGAVGLPL